MTQNNSSSYAIAKYKRSGSYSPSKRQQFLEKSEQNHNQLSQEELDEE